MKLSFIAFGLLALNLAAFGTAPNQETITCKNDHYAIVLKETAVPTYKTGTLTFSGRTLSMKCQGEFQENSQNVSFTCEEDRGGDGRYLAGIVLIGEKGSADVVHEQMYPLAPKHLATLPCELNHN